MGRANRKWINELRVVKWLSEHTEIEDLFTSKIISPSQVEKEVKSLKKNEDFKKLYTKPDGKITLVGESDKRPAIQTETDAVDVFKDYTAPDKLE